MVQTKMEIDIKEDIPQTNTLIVAIPDTGLVSIITAAAIIEQQDLEEIGDVKARDLRSVIVLEEFEQLLEHYGKFDIFHQRSMILLRETLYLEPQNRKHEFLVQDRL